MNKVRCMTCRFFSQSQVMGLCRRYPTAQNKHENDWCGEHQLTEMVTLPVVDMMAPERKKPGRKPKNAMPDQAAA